MFASGGIWLSCQWHETTHTYASLGQTSSDKEFESDFKKVYVFNKSINRIFEYNVEDKTLQALDATVTDDQITTDYSSSSDDLGGHTSDEMTWTLDRRTLRVSTMARSATDLPMPDGRLSQIRLFGAGTGSCELVGPQPLQANQF
jgi:hypothetical protein